MSIRDLPPAVATRPALVDLRSERALGRDVVADRVDRLAGLLHANLGAGAVIALLSEPSTDAYQLLVAARRADMALLPLDVSHTLEEMAFTLNASDALAIVVSSEHAALGEALAPLTPYIRLRYCLDGAFAGHRSLHLARSAAEPGPPGPGHPVGTLHTARRAGARPMAVRVPDPLLDDAGRSDLAALLGMTPLSEAAVLVPATSLSDPASCQLGTAVLESGGTVVLPARTRAVEVLRAANEANASILQLSSTIAAEIAELDEQRVRRLTPAALNRVLITAPGCSPAALARLLQLWGPAVRQAYLVPGAGVIAAAQGTELLAGPGVVGKPSADRVRIADDPDTGGPIEVRTADGERWITTGDRGRILHGRLHLLAVDFAIETTAGSVLASELEDEIRRHPAVAAVALIDSGRSPTRVHVELRPGLPSTSTIGAELERVLANCAPGAPLRLVFGPMPRAATGEVDRQRLRARRDLLDLYGPT